MTYEEIVDWLFQQVPNYQHQGGTAYKPGLSRVEELLDEIGNPHQRIKTIHVAGTNGKGSVSHILASVFQQHGYRVGLFTSPHIKDFRERIKVNGKWIEKELIIDFFNENKVAFEKVEPSFFEISTALAFSTFEKTNCDISIIETGLGGRLDSTNVLQPELSLITNIGIDHIGFLGDTLEGIAKEKAGIIKKGIPVVIGDVKQELKAVFEDIAKERNSEIAFSTDLPSKKVETDLLGEFQQRNLHTVKSAISILSKSWNLNLKDTNIAFTQIAKQTNFHGRFEKLGEEPLMIFDAGHNEDGIRNLMKEVSKLDFNELRIVYGASNDKNWKEILDLFPKNGIYYFAEFDSYRSVKSEEFKIQGEKNKFIYDSFSNPEEALMQCKSDADKSDLILVCGSFYLMEKII